MYYNSLILDIKLIESHELPVCYTKKCVRTNMLTVTDATPVQQAYKSILHITSSSQLKNHSLLSRLVVHRRSRSPKGTPMRIIQAKNCGQTLNGAMSSNSEKNQSRYDDELPDENPIHLDCIWTRQTLF